MVRDITMSNYLISKYAFVRFKNMFSSVELFSACVLIYHFTTFVTLVGVLDFFSKEVVSRASL